MQKQVRLGIILCFLVACDAVEPAQPFVWTSPRAATSLRPVRERERVEVATDDLAASSVDFLAAWRPRLGVGADDQFTVRRIHDGQDGRRHIRLRQLHRGVPVFGGDVVVHGQLDSYDGVTGDIAADLDVDVAPALIPETALQLAQKNLWRDSKSGVVDLETQDAELVIYPSKNGAFLAYYCTLSSALNGKSNPAIWKIIIDANSGEIIKTWNALHTQAGEGTGEIRQASGPGGNYKIQRDWVNALDVSDTPRGFVMATSRLQTMLGYDWELLPVDMIRSDLNLFNFNAANDAHGFTEQVLDMMNNWYGYNSIDGDGLMVMSVVDYGCYDNAYWNGYQVHYGLGCEVFWPLSGAIDVVGHEINHGFTQYHSDLIYSGESGALNESFSDIAGTLAEFFIEGESADLLIGEDVMVSSERTALRYLCPWWEDKESLSHYRELTPETDVHYSSGIGNKAFCVAARRLASGSPYGTATVASVRRAGEAWYAANAHYWTSASTYQQGCQGVLDAAKSLNFSVDEMRQIRQAWSSVGVTCGDVCDERIVADEGEISSINYPNNYPSYHEYRWCISSASGEDVVLEFDAFDTEARFDVVNVTDATGTVLASGSGQLPPAPVSAPALNVSFSSDFNGEATGFRARWRPAAPKPPPPPPELIVNYPQDGAVLSGYVTLDALATAPEGIAYVEFLLPSDLRYRDDTAPYSIGWSTNASLDVAGALVIRAMTNSGVVLEQRRSVTVDNGCAGKTFAFGAVPQAISSNSGGVVVELVVDGVADALNTFFDLSIEFEMQGNSVILESPDGSVDVVLSNVEAVDRLDIHHKWTSIGHAKPVDGVWRLRVEPVIRALEANLLEWSITSGGSCWPK